MYGDITRTATGHIVKRFWGQVDMISTQDCWHWLGKTDDSGYGIFLLNGKKYRAHRVAYWLRYGSFYDMPLLRHQCDNRSCVNPYHLIPGTHAENRRDIDERDRGNYQLGEDNHQSKLTADEVREIDEALNEGEPKAVIAARYGVSYETIRLIAVGKLWGHVTGR